MKMRTRGISRGILLILAIAILNTTLALAASVSYSVQMNALDASGNLTSQTEVYNQECENKCTFPNTLDPQENNTLVNYTISYPNGNYKVYFTMTSTEFSQQNDTITIEMIPEEVTPPSVPQISCTNEKCDSGCIRCEDNQCHNPGFQCVSELTLEKITPEIMKTGQSQLNILFRNTGTINLKDVSAEVTGDGITTMEKITLDKLIVGDKDYVFTKVNVTKPGKIDLIVKIYVDGKVTSRLVSQLSVIEEKKIEIKPAVEETFNKTEILQKLETSRIEYYRLEEIYQQKKGEYSLELVSERLKEAYSYISSAEMAFYGGDYKKAETSIELASQRIDTIEHSIEAAHKKERKTADTIKENLTYIASFAAAIITIITATTLLNKAINKEKLAKLTEKVKLKKKTSSEDQKEDKKEKTGSADKTAKKKKKSRKVRSGRIAFNAGQKLDDVEETEE